MTSRSLANGSGTSRHSAQLSGHRNVSVGELKGPSRAPSLPGSNAKIAGPGNDGSRENHISGGSQGVAHNLAQSRPHVNEEKLQGMESKANDKLVQALSHRQANVAIQAKQAQHQQQSHVPVDHSNHDAAGRRPASGTTSSKQSAWSGGFSGMCQSKDILISCAFFLYANCA